MHRAARVSLPLVVFAALVLAACSSSATDEKQPASSEVMASPTNTVSPLLEPLSEAARVSGFPSGNRYVPGTVDLTRPPIRLETNSIPVWVAAVEDSSGLVIALVTENHSLFMVRSEGTRTIGMSTQPWDRNTPPVLVADRGQVRLLERPDGASPLTAPAVRAGQEIWLTPEGDLIGLDTPNVTLLADSRIVQSSRGELAILSEPTTEYRHGVLGDAVEAASVTVIGEERPVTIPAPAGTVFEAVAPMWADVDDDGLDELLVTASDSGGGARLTVYEPDGSLVGSSPPIGRGNRWLNQLAVAPTGPAGETEIIEVRTPHIGGIVRWHRLIEGDFALVATASEYSTHRIGSRNVDQGVVVDTTGDGRPETLVPTQDQESLVALGRAGEQATVLTTVELGGRLSTNLEVLKLSDGSAALIAGTDQGVLLIWT